MKQSSPLPSRHCERSVAIQFLSSRHCERNEAIQHPLLPSLRTKWSNPAPTPPVIASEAWQSSTPGIEFGGLFYPSDSSEVKFEGHSCIIDLPDTLIWGSFLHHRPARHPNLGVKLPAPRKLSPPSSQNQQTKANPRIYFLPPQEATTGSPQRNEVEIGRNWHEVPEGLCGGQEGRCRRQQEFSPITTIAVHL